MTDSVSLPDPPAANQDKDEPIATTPSVQAAAGTSEESGGIGAVRTTANAPPGKPDGEVDTRA